MSINMMYIYFSIQNYNNKLQMKNIDVDYLLKENRKIRMELKEANDMCRLHKQAVLDISQQLGNTN